MRYARFAFVVVILFLATSCTYEKNLLLYNTNSYPVTVKFYRQVMPWDRSKTGSGRWASLEPSDVVIEPAGWSKPYEILSYWFVTG